MEGAGADSVQLKFACILQCRNNRMNLLFYCFYDWKEGGQNQPLSRKYKGKNHPIKRKIKQIYIYLFDTAFVRPNT